MDKVAVSRGVKKLLAQGKLERHFSDDDKRRSVLTLSDSGWSVYQQIIPMAKEYEKKLLSSLNDNDQLLLENLLNKLESEQSHLQEQA